MPPPNIRCARRHAPQPSPTVRSRRRQGARAGPDPPVGPARPSRHPRAAAAARDRARRRPGPGLVGAGRDRDAGQARRPRRLPRVRRAPGSRSTRNACSSAASASCSACWRPSPRAPRYERLADGLWRWTRATPSGTRGEFGAAGRAVTSPTRAARTMLIDPLLDGTRTLDAYVDRRRGGRGDDPLPRARQRRARGALGRVVSGAPGRRAGGCPTARRSTPTRACARH